MTITDIPCVVGHWAVAAADKVAFGEDFGVGVNWAPVPTRQGPQVVFMVLLTMRSPLLGQGPLFALGQIASPQPTQEQVEGCVGELARQIRELSARVLAQGNGNPG